MNINFKVFDKELTKEKITSCIIFQQDIIYEYYKNRKMADKVHKVNSVSKSVLSMIFGIAIDKGYFKDGVNTPMSKYFPNLPEFMKEITLYHLLTMSPGYRWEELLKKVYSHLQKKTYLLL